MSTAVVKNNRAQGASTSTIVMILVVVLFLLVLLRTAWVSDDAYITFRTVSNLAAHKGLTWNVDERVQAFTHPLWLVLMTVAFYFTHEFFFTSLVVSIAVSVIAVAFFAKWIAGTPTAALLGIGVLLLSRAFVDYSTSGLENPLTHLLLLAFIGIFLGHSIGHAKLFFLALLSSLTVLCRPDAILILLPALCYSFWQVHSWRGIYALLLGAVPLVAWEGFSLLYYGFPFPNTAYAKLGSNLQAGELIQQGFFYLLSTVGNDSITALGIVSALLFAATERRGRSLAVGIGILLYLVYVVRIGGDFMRGRFLTAPLIASVCLIVYGRTFNLRQLAAGVLIVGLTALGPLYWPGFSSPSLSQGLNVDGWGVADERAVYSPTSSLMAARRYLSMPSHGWVMEGIAARTSGKAVVLSGNIGFFGFFAGRSVHVVDERGLADPLLARLPPEPSIVWRVGHFTRFPPEGYMESLAAGRNLIRDPDLAAYYDKLTLITRGALLDPQRLITILRFNLGEYDYLISRYEYSLLLHITPQDLAGTSNRQFKRDAAGMLLFPSGGVEIRLPGVSRARRLRVTLNDRSSYILQFRAGSDLIATVILQNDGSSGVMKTSELGIPASASGRGYDSVTILPGSASGDYPIGPFELVP